MKGNVKMLALYLAYLDDENDKELFAHIYNSYRKQMVQTAFLIVNNNHDAEDVVEEVFLRIAQKYFDVVRSIKDETDLRNYLLKAAKNTAISKSKSKKKENTSLDTVIEYNMTDNEELSDDTFVEFICNKIDRDQIVEAIKSLNEKYRDVLYYHFVMELTVPQTAKLLDQTTSTTKKQLVRGKKMLLDLLEIEGVEDNGNQ
ncbi:MAG: sigma-70 family RNA polymerase sigma factor [Ruminococcaceae bacterium]|nr:sigma-70 family RNA polymerase sigma factor [Oscillospiraceae bacterium]